MSNPDRLVVVGLVALAAGVAFPALAGTAAPPAVVAVLIPLGLGALAGGLVLRRRRASGSSDPTRTIVSRTGWRLGAVAGGALALVALLLAVFLAEGEARGHVLFHALFGLAALSIFVVLGLLWDRSPATSAAWGQRRAFLVVLWLASAAALIEGIGGAGYDRFNAGRRVPWLTSVHNAATAAGTLTVLVLPIGVVVLAIVVVSRLRRSAAATR